MSATTRSDQQILDALDQEKSIEGAWRILGARGKAPGSFRRRCRRVLQKQRGTQVPANPDDVLDARTGWAPDQRSYHEAPPGQFLRGLTLNLDGKGKIKQSWPKFWHDREDYQQAVVEWSAGLAEGVRGAADPIPSPERTMPELLTGYIIGDAHFGMLSWADETGVNYDLKIAERLLCGGIDRLVLKTEPSDTAVVVDLGDLTHTDNQSNSTPASGNRLDVDGRYAKICRVSSRCLRYYIDRVLQKHTTVYVFVLRGNHNVDSAIWQQIHLDAVYEREPRVVVEMSPSHYQKFEFGNVLLGFTHKPKKAHRLSQLMASRWREEWGRTEHHHFLTGDRHHKIQEEDPGCLIETFSTLAPPDGWHDESGYFGARRQMTSVTWHRRHGEVGRSSVSAAEIEESM